MRATRKHGVEAVRKNLPALLDQANRGHTVMVTKHGKPYAAIVPVEQAARHQGPALSALRGTGKGLWGRNAGARIDVANPVGVPENFVLMIESEHFSRHCHSVWSRDKQIGVAFD